MTCPTCEDRAYVSAPTGWVPCNYCESGRKISKGIRKKIARWAKKRGITPPAPRKAVERPPMWHEKETE